MTTMKKTMGVIMLTGAAVAATTFGSPPASSAVTRKDGAAVALASSSGQTVVDWNEQLLAIQKMPGAQPPTRHPTRDLAMLHAAMYDAVASITHRDRPYLF